MDEFKYFMPFGKVEKTDDGCRLVSGYASTPRLDLDGEVVSTAAVKKALPSYMEWRNIRQMHQPIAVGTAKEAHTDDDGLYITAKIVDPACVKLIDEDVLKGFSIGGKKVAKKGNVITDIELIEISVVDRPANPDCSFTVQKSAKDVRMGEVLELVDAQPDGELGWFRKTVERLLFDKPPPVSVMNTIAKAAVVDEPANDIDPEYTELVKREFSTAEREQAASSGEAMPGGGYPIKSVSDLKNAVQAFGRAKNKDATKKHIIRRAKSLKATEHLPPDWEGSTKEKAAVVVAEGAAALALALADDPLFGGDGLAKGADPLTLADDPLFGGTGPGGVDKALLADPLFGVENPPLVVEFAKSRESALILEPDARQRLAKGCGVVADLAYAFGSIREAQRRLIAEGFVEKDGDDHALAQKLGEIASELASVMAQKAEHEGSEAQFLTDADDISSWIMREGVFEMAENPTDLLKRRAGAAKAMLGKAAHHLMKAGKSHAEMQKCMGKLAGMHGAFVRKTAAATKAGETADAFDHGAAMKLISQAHGHAEEAGDHMEMAHQALGKAAGAGDGAANADAGGEANGTVIGNWGGSSVSGKSPPEMTEGEVPWYEADEPYPGKAAAVRLQSGSVPEGYVTKAQAELMAENAAMKAQLAGFSKTPAGVFKGRTAVVIPGDDGSNGADDLSLMMKGIEHVDQNDPASVTNAAGKMIGNMLANAGRFGKSVFDPTFRGQAGVKRVAG